jgi:adenylate cyclase
VKSFRLSRIRPVYAGIAASVLVAATLFWLGEAALNTQREQFFDGMTQWVSSPSSPDLVVIDVDRQTQQSLDDRTAIGTVPSVLGFLVGDAAGERPMPVPPVAVRRPVGIPELWFIDGAETSCGFLQAKSHSAAAAFLVGDEDARVRRVQAYTILGNDAYPAFGIEAARLELGNGTPILGGEPPWLKLETRLLQFDGNGSMRFVAGSEQRIGARTVSAGDVLAGRIAPERLSGKVVMIGSSLPTLGGLRSTASMPLEPSVQVHADIANAVLTGFIPHRDAAQRPIEAAIAAFGGILLALIATRLRPITSALLGLLAVMATVAAAAVLYRLDALLFDAPGVSLALLIVLAVTTTLQFAKVRRSESTARAKFSQYLPQSVVQRYIDNPDDNPASSEERPVTALFTDIEGFSTLTHKLSPRDLVALLDIYYAEVNALVAIHGGMVDKVVGDAVHAFFNAPEDLEDHVNKAIDCAEAIHVLTEEMRTRAGFIEYEFGRTRIGIETGIAVLGEVGAGGKLDYTAHGDAINLAARLQEANKFLGTFICIGPEACVQSGRPLRSLGMHEIRGFGEMELFTTPD